jgi:hypothetical protein
MESFATAAPRSPQVRRPRFYWGRSWKPAAAGMLLCATCPVLCLAAPPETDRLYGYTDERGVLNFSDAPSDPRHRLILESRSRAVGTARETPARRHRLPEGLSPLIRDAAARHRLDPALVQAVAFVESRFEHRARSPKGALGLMQLMPATAARFGVTDPWDARQNLAGGARYLRELLDRFDDSLPLALAAYNAGEGAVERHGKRIPPYAETQAYVPKVLLHYGQFRGQR